MTLKIFADVVLRQTIMPKLVIPFPLLEEDPPFLNICKTTMRDLSLPAIKDKFHATLLIIINPLVHDHDQILATVAIANHLMDKILQVIMHPLLPLRLIVKATMCHMLTQLITVNNRII